MKPIFSTDDDESRQKECIELMKKKFQEISNLETEYEIIQVLNGGKSGASIQKVRHRTTGEEVVLKIYKTDKYNPIDLDPKTVSRPVREIYTTCVMSGTEGFPTVYDFGIITDKEDKNNYLYLISELVSGEPMNEVDMSRFSSEQKASILLQLLNLLYVAKHKLGKFIHNDLHPGNIFIDTGKFYTSEINFGPTDRRKFKQPHPKVTIIDFDLSVSKRYSKDPNLRHGIALPASVFEWISKIFKFNITQIGKILTKSSIGETEDLTIWNVYYIGLSMLQWQQSHSRITEDDINKVIHDAVMCDNLEGCLSHPYINDNMNDTRTQYRGGEPEFTPPIISEERKEIEKHLNLIIDTMLEPIGLDAIGKSFMESYSELNKVYYFQHGTSIPYDKLEKIIFFLRFTVAPEKVLTLKIDSCLTGNLGNLNVDVILPDTILIKLFLKDKKVEIVFIPEDNGLKITNITHQRWFSIFESLVLRPFLYFINPIIHNIAIISSDQPIGSTVLKANYSTRRNDSKELTTVIPPPPSDIEFKEQIENIMKYFIPTLFRNIHIFKRTVSYQAMIEEDDDVVLVGDFVEKEWSDIVEKILKSDTKNLLTSIFGSK